MRQHPSQTEGNLLREFFSVHGDFETIAKVDVHDFPGTPLKKEIGRMPVSETKDMADHAIDR